MGYHTATGVVTPLILRILPEMLSALVRVRFQQVHQNHI